MSWTHGLGAQLRHSAAGNPEAIALVEGKRSLTYADLLEQTQQLAGWLLDAGLERFARVAVYMDKSIECVVSIYAAAAAGLLFVPINPKLKAPQVGHILRDCSAAVLITTAHRFRDLAQAVDLAAVKCIVVGDRRGPEWAESAHIAWNAVQSQTNLGAAMHRCIEADPAAILYTSGSTGMPKGVVLSHRNLEVAVQSVGSYFHMSAADTVLALLPISFDAGLNQVAMAIAYGARVVLTSYLRPVEVVRICATERVSVILGVPPLWSQLVGAPWRESGASVRLFGNTGGPMSAALLASLRAIFPQATPILMYGLTEAFRSTYLDPAQIDVKPGSVGKAMPNVEVLLLREDGTVCDAGEEGELVHRGPLVALGYWNDPARTAERFRPLPSRLSRGLLPEVAVWSGDIFRTDAEGSLYFVGRRDEMFKSSGYRISPSEIESVLHALPGVQEAVVFPICDESRGTIPAAAVVPAVPPLELDVILDYCGKALPSYMVPVLLEATPLPRLANGKIDRAGVRKLYDAQPRMSALTHGA
jgi:acyl-CoA ligase (AMP-forming) (exosortase A-associated)